jgi:hypothetical protein
MYNANYKRPFIQFVKKQSRALQASIEDEVILICENPDYSGPIVQTQFA